MGDIKFDKENVELIGLAWKYLRQPDRTWTMEWAQKLKFKFPFRANFLFDSPGFTFHKKIIQKQPLHYKWNRLDARFSSTIV